MIFTNKTSLPYLTMEHSKLNNSGGERLKICSVRGYIFPYTWEIRAYTYIMKAADYWKLVSVLALNFLQIFNYPFVILTALLSIPGVWYHESKTKRNKNVNSHSSHFVCNWAHEIRKLELQPVFQLFILCCLHNFTYSIQL